MSTINPWVRHGSWRLAGTNLTSTIVESLTRERCNALWLVHSAANRGEKNKIISLKCNKYFK